MWWIASSIIVTHFRLHPTSILCIRPCMPLKRFFYVCVVLKRLSFSSFSVIQNIVSLCAFMLFRMCDLYKFFWKWCKQKIWYFVVTFFCWILIFMIKLATVNSVCFDAFNQQIIKIKIYSKIFVLVYSKIVQWNISSHFLFI